MLRKTTAFFVLLLFLALPASAQVSGLGGIGVKGGVDFATLRADDDEGVGYQTDFLVGIYGQIPTHSFFTVQPELLYVRKGASIEEGGTEGTYNLDYIELPILFKLGVPLEGGFSPNIYAGPYGALAVNRTVDVEGEGSSISVDADELFKSTDFGLALGVEFDFGVQGNLVTLGGRYDLGLVSVNEDEVEGEAIDDDIKTGTFMITLGFAI